VKDVSLPWAATVSNKQVLERLVAYLREEVSMVRQFDVRSAGVDASGLVLEVPLAINFNDKRTAFAGTLASLCTLSGWAMTSLVCEAAGLKADIAAVHSEIAYARPCTEEKVQAACAWPADATAAAFTTALASQGRANLSLSAQVLSRGKVAVRFSASYIARML
jgi:thioesterase domain-containing protein